MERYRRLTIFIAEDCDDDIEIARRAFRRCRLVGDMPIARDGEEALRLLHARQAESKLPDLILLDINLPRLNGFEVLTNLRADLHFSAMPVIMMSASGREEDVLRSYRLGANSFIEKPSVFERFVETLDVMAKYWFEIARLPRQLGGATDER